jgi:prolyl oligopeptidase
MSDRPYPEAREGDQVDDLHGVRVADPYRWLEDPDSPETRRWIEAENALSSERFGRVPERAAIRSRLTELWNYERTSPPEREGSRWFFSKNDGLQNQAVLYWLDRIDGAPKVLLDPNHLSKDGTVALSALEISQDGDRIAYALSEGGSDWMEWHVRDVATGHDLSDRIRWSKFSGASWTKDQRGFFYSRYPEPGQKGALEDANYFHKLYYHRIGAPQSEDELVYEDRDHKERGFEGSVTEDGKHLVIHVWEGTDRKNRLYTRDLTKKNAPVVKLFDAFDAAYHFVGNVGSTFFVKTDLDAPRGRLIAFDLAKPDRAHWREVLPQGPNKLEFATLIGGGILAGWLENAHTTVSFHGRDGAKKREIALPGLGSAGGFGGKSEDKETFYSFTSFTHPGSIYRLDLATGQSTLWRRPAVKFDPDDYVTEQVFYPGKDGTRIPMFLVMKKGLPKTGDRPTYLYGYGGFNISLTPAFAPSLLVWLERGGVFAQPNLRGGGEFGEDWHRAGMLENKQTVFDDFAAAGQALVSLGITRPDEIAIAGGSNGGLLVGASIVQHPELFGAAVIQVGVLDMLRFHKFTIGHAWASEYGTADDPAQFRTLLAYSPLHNLKRGTHYPATLIMTGDHDDRVVPAHSFKFAAALQKAQGGRAPILIRVETEAGHGAGKPTTKLIDEAADKWAFLIDALAASRSLE